METNINIIQAISDNRFWLLPVILVGALGILAVEVKSIFINIMEEMD